MPPLSATQETLPVTHLVGYSPTESSLLVTSSIAKGMDVMSQSGALALEAVWTLYPQRPRDCPGAGSQAFLGGEGEREEDARGFRPLSAVWDGTFAPPTAATQPGGSPSPNSASLFNSVLDWKPRAANEESEG